jgi:hypothetical protein
MGDVADDDPGVVSDVEIPDVPLLVLPVGEV